MIDCMERKRTIDFGQGPTEVVEVSFRAGTENWNEYLLDDGTVMRIKLVVTDVYRVIDAHDPEGNPVYFSKSTNVISVSVPEDNQKG